MTITSTEFQQNVGHYLQLADKGEEINIEKKKPVKALYILKKKKATAVKDENRTTINGIPKDEFLKELKKYMFKGKSGETGLELQARVRS